MVFHQEKVKWMEEYCQVEKIKVYWDHHRLSLSAPVAISSESYFAQIIQEVGE